MEITAKDIRPKVKGESDFFSWQLYRWANKRPNALKIWSGTWNSCSGIDAENRVLYIGFEREGSCIHARALRNLCNYRSNLDCWAYGPAHDTQNWTDVTEKFWGNYFKIGVCAIHGDYSHSWNVIGNLRVCSYCGKREERKSKIAIKRYWA